MRRSTLDELADRYGIERPPDTRYQRFPNFGGFSATYQAAVECLRTTDDLARLVLEVAEDAVDPDAFIRWTYAQALAHRQPLYEAMARNWGITVEAEDMARVRDAADFDEVIAAALPAD